MKNIVKNTQKEIIIKCDCMDMDHIIAFTYFEDEDPDGWLYFTSALNASVSFWRRVYLAIKYIFKINPYKQTMFGESLLLPSDARDIVQFLHKYNDFIDRNNLFR